MISILLPWPPSTLSPNRRQHWAKLAKEKKKYKEICFFETIAQSSKKIEIKSSAHISLKFNPPNMRRYDKDNLLARMKSGIDGICTALNIDDHVFKSIAVLDGECHKGSGSVLISILPK